MTACGDHDSGFVIKSTCERIGVNSQTQVGDRKVDNGRVVRAPGVACGNFIPHVTDVHLRLPIL